MKPLDCLEISITKYPVTQDHFPEELIRHPRLYEMNTKKKFSSSYFLVFLDHKFKSVNPAKPEAMNYVFN